MGYYQDGRDAAATGLRSPQTGSSSRSRRPSGSSPYRQAFKTAFSVSWQNVKWNHGGWAQSPPMPPQGASITGTGRR